MLWDLSEIFNAEVVAEIDGDGGGGGGESTAAGEVQEALSAEGSDVGSSNEDGHIDVDEIVPFIPELEVDAAGAIADEIGHDAVRVPVPFYMDFTFL